MAFYRVTYGGMTARYSGIVEADDEYSAKMKFAGNAFSKGEMSLINARQLSLAEIRNSMNRDDE